MIVTWVFALLGSFGLRQWGLNHPDPFVIRPFIVWSLLIGPSILLGSVVFLNGFRNTKN